MKGLWKKQSERMAFLRPPGRGKTLRSQLPSVSAGGDYGKGLFNREMGPLQSQLSQGEYALLRLAPMLESDFVQINKRGEVIDVHNQVQTVTVGVACTSSSMTVPNVLLLARPTCPPKETPQKFKTLLRQSSSSLGLELTRLIPLHFVKISLHNAEKKQLRFKLASGRTFYLQLCPQPGAKEDVFKLWVKVVNMLRPPSDQGPLLHSKSEDPGGSGEAMTDRAQSLGSLNLEETVSIRSIYSPAEVRSPAQEDVRSRRSLVFSMGSQPSSRAPSPSPFESEGRTTEFEDLGVPEPLERPPSTRSQGSQPERTERSPRMSRKSSKSRSSRRKSPRRSSSRRPSKIISLIRSCSWGRRKRSKSRDARSRGKGKKR
ncbi:Golgi-associated RAB2 interactor protein 3-like [Podarcis raffonei]|uniref:Golgi-associated RAB2 interactor protein 3-like n=1 Tax=Podarcis raffonei TaxID=65483 RepID=UPI0023290A22|nr:Golgi-associated RAB2 interactor protein 3-like [Podarcis raffonei]